MSHSDSDNPRLLDQVRDLTRVRHYSIRTEQAYLQWIRRFVLFHGKRHPRDLGGPEVTAFLSDLAVRKNVAASTQNQALNAILFLYREVLHVELPWLQDVQRAKPAHHLPVVLTREEVKHLLAQLEGTLWLMGSLTYGAGLRLLECLRLRVKDLDLHRGELLWPRVPTLCAREKVSERGSRVGLAICLSVQSALYRSAVADRTTSSCSARCTTASREKCRSQSPDHQASECSYVAAFLCYAFARVGL